MTSYLLKVTIENNGVRLFEGVPNNFNLADIIKAFLRISYFSSAFQAHRKRFVNVGIPLKLSLELRSQQLHHNSTVGLIRYCFLEDKCLERLSKYQDQVHTFLFDQEPSALKEILKSFVEIARRERGETLAKTETVHDEWRPVSAKEEDILMAEQSRMETTYEQLMTQQRPYENDIWGFPPALSTNFTFPQSKFTFPPAPSTSTSFGASTCATPPAYKSSALHYHHQFGGAPVFSSAANGAVTVPPSLLQHKPTAISQADADKSRGTTEEMEIDEIDRDPASKQHINRMQTCDDPPWKNIFDSVTGETGPPPKKYKFL